MTVKEKIQSKNGYISKHEAVDPSLKIKAQNLTWEFNNTRPDENEKRSEILQELFGTCSPLTFIEPTFKCDYGFNIHTEGLTIINYNCVMLDTSPIHIGVNAFILVQVMPLTQLSVVWELELLSRLLWKKMFG